MGRHITGAKRSIQEEETERKYHSTLLLTLQETQEIQSGQEVGVAKSHLTGRELASPGMPQVGRALPLLPRFPL